MILRTLLVLALSSPAAALPAAAQSNGSVSGTVVSATSGEPLAGATVTVVRVADSTASASVSTTEQGRFRADGLAPGRYGVTVAFLGYTSHTVDVVEVTATAPAVDLGTIRLELAPVELDAIEARTARSPVQILTDRTVYTTADMPASKGGTATDLLRQVTELEVDINGNVSMRGNQSVSIHLNGRPAPLQGDALANFLQQMPADRIAKVEVMPNPTAKHDPEGTGGIVNIIMVENADLGLSGNVSARYGTRGTKGFDGRLNYQKGRLTFFSGVGVNFGNFEDDRFDVRRNLLATPVTVLEQRGRSEFEHTFTMFDLTAEYRLAEHTTAWLTGMGYGSGSSNRSAMLYGLYSEERDLLDNYDRITDSEDDWGTADFAAGVKHAFVPQRHELTVDVRRNGHGNDSHSYIEKLSRIGPDPGLAEIRETDRDNENTGLTLRLDYTRPLGEKGKIDAGLNVGRRNLNDDALLDIFADGAGEPTEHDASRFTHREDFRSLYITAAQTFGKLGVQLGLRGELAETRFTVHTTDESFDNDYRSLFPSANLSWTLAEGQTMRFNYAKRISRPYAGILNPDVPPGDPLNVNVGNPLLKPSYTHSFGLDYSRIGKLGTLRFAPYFRRSTDGWDNIRRVDANGVSTTTWENTASTTSMGANITTSLRPAGRFNGSLTLGAFRYESDATNISPELSQSSWRWSLGGNLTAKLTSTLNAQMNSSYRPAREVAQGRYSAMFYSSVGLRQQLLTNRATISLFLTDPFNLYEYSFETRDRSFVQSSRTSVSLRSANLTFTWNFGKPPEQVSRREGPEVVDEATRIR